MPNVPFIQLLLAVSIPTVVAIIGVILNQTSMNRLSHKVDQHYERR